MARWTAPTWREWFFEVFAPSGYIPFRPLPMNDAERREKAERELPSKDITRLNLGSDQTPR